jgi:hypothetical protein
MTADELLNFNGKQVFENTRDAASYHDTKPLTWWQASKHFFWHHLHLISGEQQNK